MERPVYISNHNRSTFPGTAPPRILSLLKHVITIEKCDDYDGPLRRDSRRRN